LGASLQILLLASIKSASCKAPIRFRQLPESFVTYQTPREWFSSASRVEGDRAQGSSKAVEEGG
jgi:hypothetical protein